MERVGKGVAYASSDGLIMDGMGTRSVAAVLKESKVFVRVRRVPLRATERLLRKWRRREEPLRVDEDSSIVGSWISKTRSGGPNLIWR